MLFLKSIVLLFVAYSARGDDCVTYSFEEGFEDFFNDNAGIMCPVIQQSWVERQYIDTNIPAPNELSTKFIAPLTTPSCTSSFEFSMANGGVLAFNIYMGDSDSSDQLTVLVTEKLDDGTEATAGTLIISPGSNNYVAGWSLQRLTVVGSETFQGYISFFGLATENSVVLVDSFRYIPPGQDEDTCEVYDLASITTPVYEEISTTVADNDVSEFTASDETEATQTTESVTITDGPEVTNPATEGTQTTNDDIITTTGAAITDVPEVTYTTTEAVQTTESVAITEEPEVTYTTQAIEENIQTTQATESAVESCTTYNFESGYDLHFFNDNYLCAGLLPWQLDNYTSIDIASPNSQSTAFITPHESVSCMNSFVFKMDPEGVVEANVYMDPVQALDHIIILAHRVTGREFDTTAGFKMYHPANEVFVVGWNVIRFSLLELTSFDGYLIFIGSADPGSTVLVDSIRYIPPQTPVDDASCNLY